MQIVPTNDSSQVGMAIVKKYEKLKTQKSLWEPHWKDVSEYAVPMKDNIYGGAVQGEKKHNLLYDSIGVNSCERLASALHSMLTNPSTTWFALSSGNPDIDKIRSVAVWLQASARKMIAVMNNSNFQPEVHEVYIDLAGFGTSHMRVEEDENDIVRFESSPIYTVAVAENYLGLIDTTYYDYEMTLDQMVEHFGEENIPKELLDKQRQDPLCKETIVHAVEPWYKMPNKLQYGKFPYTSVHVHKSTGKILLLKGFEENPCIVSRYSKLSGEIYGRSPAMKALPDIKMVNQMKKAFIEAAQLKVTPPLQAPDDGVLLPIRTKPNSINYYRAGTKDRIEKLDIGGDIGMGADIIENIHQSVRESFLIDQLYLAQRDRMTTVEVMQRRDEQLRSFSPILGRIQHEFLRPLVERVFGICMRKGILDGIPEELASAKLEVKFVSQIAKVQESVEADNFMRAFQAIVPIAQAQPDVMDLLDGDAIVKFSIAKFGAPVELLRDDKNVKTIRDNRTQQMQAQQQMVAQQNQAEIINKTAPALPQE